MYLLQCHVQVVTAWWVVHYVGLTEFSVRCRGILAIILVTHYVGMLTRRCRPSLSSSSPRPRVVLGRAQLLVVNIPPSCRSSLMFTSVCWVAWVVMSRPAVRWWFKDVLEPEMFQVDTGRPYTMDTSKIHSIPWCQGEKFLGTG
jgi:hypothetical protein